VRHTQAFIRCIGLVALSPALFGCPLTVSDDYELGTPGAGADGGSSTGGAGGAGGAGGGAGAATGGGVSTMAQCPTGLAGPNMVAALTPAADVFCIDSTEVTNAQYQQFLDTSPGLDAQPSYCSFNGDFTPKAGWPSTEPNWPVGNVNWCDAFAYCAAAGKRLCGRVGGGSGSFSSPDAQDNQWTFACSGGALSYPYGQSYSANACNTVEGAVGGPVDVGSLNECAGTFEGLFDMSGNVAEWTDACEAEVGELDRCSARSSSWMWGSWESRCAWGFQERRGDTYPDVGFRCCLDIDVSCTDVSCLNDDGLVVRYFIDEAATDQDVKELADAAPNPLPLPLTYVSGMSFVEESGHRGLRWNAEGLDGRPTVPVDGTKVAVALEGSQFATIELVIQLEAVDSLSSRIFHIGTGSELGAFSLASQDVTEVRFNLNDNHYVSWSYDVLSAERRVLHTVFDTSLADANDRVKLFVNGAPATSTSADPPTPNETIKLGTGRDFVLGNREIGGRSFQGTLFYAALYQRALSVDEVLNHAAVLLGMDDK